MDYPIRRKTSKELEDSCEHLVTEVTSLSRNEARCLNCDKILTELELHNGNDERGTITIHGDVA